MIVNPDEVAGLTAMPSITHDDLDAPTKALEDMSIAASRQSKASDGHRSRSGSCDSSVSSGGAAKARAFAQAIDAKVKADKGSYVNDLMRNSKRPVPRQRNERLGSSASMSSNDSSVGAGGDVAKAAVKPSSSEDGTSSTVPMSEASVGSSDDEGSLYRRLQQDQRRAVGTVEATTNVRPRDFARQIDARVRSNQSAYTNDLLRLQQQQGGRNNLGGRSSNHYRSMAQAIPEDGHMVEFSIEGREEELYHELAMRQQHLNALEDDCNSSLSSSISWMEPSMQGYYNGSSPQGRKIPNQAVIDDRDIRAQEERQIMELAMEQSMQEARRNEQRGGAMTREELMEQEILELAMEQSMREQQQQQQHYAEQQRRHDPRYVPRQDTYAGGYADEYDQYDGYQQQQQQQQQVPHYAEHQGQYASSAHPHHHHHAYGGHSSGRNYGAGGAGGGYSYR